MEEKKFRQKFAYGCGQAAAIVVAACLCALVVGGVVALTLTLLAWMF